MRLTARLVGAVMGALLLTSVLAPGASAYQFDRPLKAGDKGRDVKALQVRIAGWFPEHNQVDFPIDGSFGPKVKEALTAFQTSHGLNPDGITGKSNYRVFDELQDGDGSTAHFDWNEFTQNSSSGCSAAANAYAGTFSGGMVSPQRAKRYVRRLMWRLEALRAKAGNHVIGINSGFRSSAYNECIGGASASQHLYGDAADNRMANVSNRKERNLAKKSEFYGIGCYSNLSHNHFDLRVDNTNLPYAQFWWWPARDSQGRDLDDGGRPCLGETGTATASLAGVARALPGVGSLIPSVAEVHAFQVAGEVDNLGSGD